MRYFVIFLVSLTPFLAKAQHPEFGILIGASNYMGDLANNTSTIYFQETKLAAGAFAKYNLNNLFAVRGGFNYSQISGADANSNNKSISSRNLSFKSNLYEFNLLGEFNIPGYQPYNLAQPFSAFLFGGIGFTGFSPKANYRDEWQNLRSLGTEGQGIPEYDSPYSSVAVVLPFGIGVKWAVNDAINVGLEAGARFALTDYLDDVSGVYADYAELLNGNGETAAALSNRAGELDGTDPIILPKGTPRGDEANNDWYFTAGIFISYNFLDNGLVGIRKRRTKRSGCPN